MTDSSDNVPTKRKSLSARRVTLLASVAAVAVAVTLGAPFAYHRVSLADAIPPVHAAPIYPDEPTASPVGFANIVARVKPAVIAVRVKTEQMPEAASANEDDDSLPSQPAPNAPQRRQTITAMGSGFFISSDGYAVTNNHVVDHAQSVQVTTDDGKSYAAKVIGTDPKADLALIKVDGTDFPHVRFADHPPREGDWVVAIGNPYGLGGTVTAGIVSAHGRDIGSGPYDDFIQIDAPINKGNSGGPAFDVNGNVIGVNTAIFSPSGGSVGIGFDIPAATAKAVIAQLKDKGHVTRGWIGVQVQPVTADIADSLGMKTANGALVDEAQPASPAAKAGIKSGDVITAVDGATIKDSRQLAQTIGAMSPDKSVTLNVIRNGESKTFTVTLGTLPGEQTAAVEGERSGTPANRGPHLGLTLAPAGNVAGAGEQGVVVVAVDPDGPAAEHGVQVGDVILAVGEKTVSNPNDVRQDLAELRKSGKHTVLMRIKSGEATRFVALPLGHA
jgi:serine protease Do